MHSIFQHEIFQQEIDLFAHLVATIEIVPMPLTLDHISHVPNNGTPSDHITS
jgi:hypothetical protein